MPISFRHDSSEINCDQLKEAYLAAASNLNLKKENFQVSQTNDWTFTYTLPPK
jgi:hypothetical protein